MDGEAWVTVRVEKFIDGDRVDYGVPVRFRPVIGDEHKNARRFDQSRSTVTTIAPVSSFDHAAVGVFLPWGDYDIEAVLPSGEQIGEELTVGPNSIRSGAGAIEVVLHGEHSPNEWRSWAHFTGAQLASRRQETREDIDRKRLGSALDTRFEVSVGSLAHSDSLGGFDPSSWDGWFNFLQERYERGPELALGLELGVDVSGLEVQTEGGYDRTPLRIKFVQGHSPGIGLGARDIGERRTYAAIAGSTGTRLVAIPWPWGDSAYAAGHIPFELLAFEEGGQLRCDPVLRDGQWAGLVAYLNRGRVDLASEILASASDALFAKFQNPLAAAVGGYVLLSSGPSDEEASWPSWLSNLAEYFPHLPDGLILRARWLLARNREEDLEKAHELLYEAFNRGVPYFTTGVVWLIEGLEQTSIGCPICTEILRKVRGVARSMDLSQAFTSFSIGKPQARDAEETRPESSAPPGQALIEPDMDGLSRGQEEAATQVALPQPQYLTLRQS